MGNCCASTNAKAASAGHNHKHSHSTRPISTPPPPSHPLLEEETVKEVVLSETPVVLRPNLPKNEDHFKKVSSPKTKLPSPPKIREEYFNGSNVCKKPSSMKSEDFSEEASEICSTLSESLSTTVTERRHDGDEREVRQRAIGRSPAKSGNPSYSGDLRRDGVAGKSPARMSEQSPGRVGMVPGKERRSFVTEGQRGSSGEVSGGRTRSPATRVDGGASRFNLGKSPSTRKTGKSPGRVRSDPPEKNCKAEESERAKWPPTTNESLENPLVSLECFIFL